MMAGNVSLSRRFVYFILFQILPQAACQLQFISPYNGNKVTANLGSSANFTWAFRGGNVDLVQWGTKQDGILSIKDVLVNVDKFMTVITIQNYPYSGRVSGVWNGSSPGQVTFTLDSIQKADERLYICALEPEKLEVASVYDTVQLFVLELPVISPLSINGSYIEGSSVNISCAATGKPDPEVSWMRNGQIKSSGKKIAYLDFDRIKRTDDGLYTCRANNSAGTKTHKGILVVRYPAKILNVTSSATSSWIGQTVSLKCVSDGVPTPTLTWYKPDGNEINTVTAKESTVKVTINDEQDFGEYKCVAYNGLHPLNDGSMLLRQIEKPGSPAIISSASDIQATSLTVKWTAPADDGGSPITAYRVVIRKGGTEIKNENVTDPGTTSLSVGGLERDTKYNVKVFARNAVFEGAAAQKSIRTKIEGIPETPDIKNMPAEVQSDEVALKWTKPVSNGADITQYTVYIRNVSSNDTVGDWKKLEVIHDVSVREYVVTLKKGQRYEFVVTATNKYGESLKEKQNIQKIKVLGGSTKSTTNQNETVVRCDREVEILHAVYLSIIILLVIIIVVISVISWRKRQIPAIFKRGKRKRPSNPNVSRSSSRADSIQMATVVQQEADAQSIERSEVTSTTYEIPNSSDYMPLHPSTRSWEIRREQVNIIKNIGKGAFSQVAKATAKNINGNQDVTVAVKMLKDPLLVLIEYVPYGDLLGYLRKSRGLNDTYFNNPDRKPKTNLTSQQLMRFAWQIANGMTYLSSRKIIHRDLAARNVLVGEGEKCKVTDFGMARNVHQDDIYTKQSRMELWCPSARDSYHRYQTMLNCWEQNPSDRPTFSKLKETMKDMESNHKTYINLREYDNSLYANMEDLTAE
ncbi:hypothetical protein ACROYT_G028429 [Oculina patagonica]